MKPKTITVENQKRFSRFTLSKPLLLIALVFISGCYPNPIPYEDRTEYGKCIIDCEEPFNCKLTTFNLRIECDDKEPEEGPTPTSLMERMERDINCLQTVVNKIETNTERLESLI